MANQIFDINYGEERVKAAPISELHIYEGAVVDLPGSIAPFQIMRGSQSSILEELEFFKQRCPGVYTFFLKDKRGQPLKNAQKIVVDCNPAHIGGELNGASQGDYNTIRNQVLRELEQRENQRSKEQQIIDLEEKLMRFEKPADRLTDLLAMALTKFLAPQTNQTTLNGNKMRYPDQSKRRNQQAQEQPQEAHEDDTSLEDACAYLINLYGPDKFVKLVVKLSQDEQMKKMILHYIN